MSEHPTCWWCFEPIKGDVIPIRVDRETQNVHRECWREWRAKGMPEVARDGR